ncbi:MAG: hypothetical protein ACE5JG_01430 [Planctomycetota bacterium]
MQTRTLPLLLTLAVTIGGISTAILLLKEEDRRDCLATVQKLKRTIADEKSTWKERRAAHEEAKEALKGGDQACRILYDRIKSSVELALRRDTPSWDAWLMGFFGATLLWGGFMVCVGIARKTGKKWGAEEDQETPPWSG